MILIRGGRYRRSLAKSSDSSVYCRAWRWCLLAAVACAPQKAPRAPVDTGSKEPPLSVYGMWWDLVQSCSQRSKAIADVTWRTTLAAAGDDQGDLVRWVPATTRIDVPSTLVSNGALVRHAMLHAVLSLPPSVHPRDAFIRRCGGVVQCGDECATQGRPPSDSGAIDVPLSSIDVGVRIVPEAPSRDTLEGFAAVLVEARNPSTRRVVVKPRSSTDRWLSPLFTFELRGASMLVRNNARPPTPDFTIFEPGERKLQVFDLRIDLPPTQGGLPTGTLELKGAYQTKWASAHAPISIQP